MVCVCGEQALFSDIKAKGRVMDEFVTCATISNTDLDRLVHFRYRVQRVCCGNVACRVDVAWLRNCSRSLTPVVQVDGHAGRRGKP